MLGTDHGLEIPSGNYEGMSRVYIEGSSSAKGLHIKTSKSYSHYEP